MRITEAADKVRVLLVDDHALVADLVSGFLGASDDFEVRTCADFASALSLIASEGPFDVVLLDVVLPGSVGIESFEQAIQANQGGAVVVFSGNVATQFVEKTIAIGGKGFIPKTLPLRALGSAVRLVASGEVFLPAPSRIVPRQGSRDEKVILSHTEAEILRMVAEGHPNKEIAWRTDMSEATVKMHLRGISRKIGARNRTHAVVVGKSLGLV